MGVLTNHGYISTCSSDTSVSFAECMLFTGYYTVRQFVATYGDGDGDDESRAVRILAMIYSTMLSIHQAILSMHVSSIYPNHPFHPNNP